MSDRIKRVQKYKANCELSCKAKKVAILSESCPWILEISEDTWAQFLFNKLWPCRSRQGRLSISLCKINAGKIKQQAAKQKETSVECIFNQ